MLPVVVDDSYALKIGVHDGGADKFEASLFQLAADLFGKRVFGGHIADVRQVMVDGIAVCETPDELVEAAKLLLHLEKCLRVADGGGNFVAIANDAFVLHKLLHLARVVFCDDLRVKIVKGGAKIGLLVEDQIPAYAGLHALKHKHSKQLLIAMLRLAPPRIVIQQRLL